MEGAQHSNLCHQPAPLDASPAAAAATRRFQGATKVGFAGLRRDGRMYGQNRYQWLHVNHCSQPSQAVTRCMFQLWRTRAPLPMRQRCYYVTKCIKLLWGECAEQTGDTDGVPESRRQMKRMLFKRLSPLVALFCKNSSRSSCQPVTFSSPPHSE